MKHKFIVYILALLFISGSLQAGLWDPPVDNPSFESQQTATWANWIDDWFDDSYWGTFIINDTAYPTTYPNSPYGNIMGGVDGAGTMWQQIGTWEEDQSYMISAWIAQRSGQDFGGLEISLWAGGDDTSAADETIPDTIGATKVDSIIVNPFTASGIASVELDVILNTGTGMDAGDPLWLSFFGTTAGQKLFDNISVSDPVTLAHDPSPGSGAEVVPIATNLSWSAPEGYTVDGYDLYLGSDPNVALNPKYSMTATLFDPASDLEYETVYYWRVDALEPNELGPDPAVHKGNTWVFTTTPATPVISYIGPNPLFIEAGATAVFTVDATSPLGDTIDYKWYKTTDPATVLSTTDTLEIANAQIADEGQYYCDLTNGAGTKTSDNLTLTISRLIGHWPFDGTLDDVVAANNGMYTTTGKVPYGTGILNDALDVSAVTMAVKISRTPYTNDAWTLCWWDYAAASGAEWESMVASGASAGYELLESDRSNSVYGTGFNITGGWAWTGNYPRENWNHHVLSFDAETKNCTWYINGELVGQMIGIPFTDFDSLLYVGNCRDGSQPYYGLIDDLRLYNYPMDVIDAAKLYFDGSGIEVCIEALPYDLTDDCRVNIDDLAAFIATWMDCNLVPTCLP